MRLRSGKILLERVSVWPCASQEDIHEELLSGIPNDITLNVIVTKLNWDDIPFLASVSPGWQRAIERNLVHDARVQAGCTKIRHLSPRPYYDGTIRTSLYSTRDRSLVTLPALPGVWELYPYSYHCFSLDCKVYVLGGKMGPKRWDSPEIYSKKVYMLDLAGQKIWKQCASMIDRRQEFGVDFINGKIHVTSSNRETLIYDPKTDSWCRAKHNSK
jgi:hypothetical protein